MYVIEIRWRRSLMKVHTRCTCERYRYDQLMYMHVTYMQLLV